jgi:hypothetical protein
MLGEARAEPRRTPRIHLAIRLYSIFTPFSSLVVTLQSICADQHPASNSQHSNHALSNAATASALCYVPTSFSPMCHTRRNANDPFRMRSNWRHVLPVVLQIVSCGQKRGICSGGSDCRDPLVVFVVLPVVILPHAPVQPHESPCCNTHSSRMSYLFPFLFRLVLREF